MFCAIPMSARSKAWVCGRSLAVIPGLYSTGGHGCLSVVSVVCCQVDVSVSGRSLVRWSHTEYGVIGEGDREAPYTEVMTQNGIETPQKKKFVVASQGCDSTNLK